MNLLNPESWSDRQHLLWNYFQNQDNISSIVNWPPWAQEQILRQHKTNPQRFALFKFLVWNGLHPILATEWIRAETVRKYQGKWDLVMGEYDLNATRDFAMMIFKFQNGELFGKGARIYDLVHKRPVVT